MLKLFRSNRVVVIEYCRNLTKPGHMSAGNIKSVLEAGYGFGQKEISTRGGNGARTESQRYGFGNSCGGFEQRQRDGNLAGKVGHDILERRKSLSRDIII